MHARGLKGSHPQPASPPSIKSAQKWNRCAGEGPTAMTDLPGFRAATLQRDSVPM